MAVLLRRLGLRLLGLGRWRVLGRVLVRRSDRLRWHEWLVIGLACGAVLGVVAGVIGTILSR